MRDVYNKKPKYTEITQGSIIKGCLADGYEGCDVCGCVISARCDLAQKKVTMVHYLPIVSYEDWFEREIIEELREELIKNRKKRIVAKLRNVKLPETFLDRKLSREQIQISISANLKKSKEINSFMNDFDKWQEACHYNDKNILDESDAEGLLKHYLDLLMTHGKSEWYMLEDWNENDNRSGFVIVLLRDIKTISMDCALKLSDGLMEMEVGDDFYEKNMLVKTNDRSSLYYVESEIKSPYIEHLLQRFTNNFSRIGLKDIPKGKITEHLVDYSKTILK